MDVIEGSRIYIPAIYVINKIDQITLEELNVISKLPHYCPVCAYMEWNLDGLVEMIWEYLDLIRVYTKPKVRRPKFCQALEPFLSCLLLNLWGDQAHSLLEDISASY